MTIYFDENKEAYAQIETLNRWGKTLLYQCSDNEYKEFKEGKRIWQGNELVVNPDYEAEQAQKEAERKIEELKLKLEELDKQRIRALCEPSNRTDDQTWLEYYNEQIVEIRKELQSLQN